MLIPPVVAGAVVDVDVEGGHSVPGGVELQEDGLIVARPAATDIISHLLHRVPKYSDVVFDAVGPAVELEEVLSGISMAPRLLHVEALLNQESLERPAGGAMVLAQQEPVGEVGRVDEILEDGLLRACQS